MNDKHGKCIAHDIQGNTVSLEWEAIAGNTPMLTAKIKGLAEILVPAYSKIEIDFARKKPEDVPHDFMLKSLAPFLEHVDVFEEKVKTHLQQFFATTDWQARSNSHDMNIFVLIVDPITSQKLGVIQFLISPQLSQNTVKAALFGVTAAAQNRGLEQLLMSSIFRLYPNIHRIFLHTRSTNKLAIEMYMEWGFVSFQGTLPNWTDLEYLSQHSDTLQKIAENLPI